MPRRIPIRRSSIGCWELLIPSSIASRESTMPLKCPNISLKKLTLSRVWSTPVSPLATCSRRTGCNYWRRSSRRRTPDLLRIKNQSAIILIQPRCSSTASSPADGMAKLPLRSKRNVRDYQYLSRPEESVKTRMGSYYRSLTSCQKMRTVGIYFSAGQKKQSENMLYSLRRSMHSILCEPRERLSLDWVVREALSFENVSSVKDFTPYLSDSMFFSIVTSLVPTSTPKDWTCRVIASILRSFSLKNWKTLPLMRHIYFPKYLTILLAINSNFPLISYRSYSICTVITLSLLSTSSILLQGTSNPTGALFPSFCCNNV